MHDATCHVAARVLRDALERREHSSQLSVWLLICRWTIHCDNHTWARSTNAMTHSTMTSPRNALVCVLSTATAGAVTWPVTDCLARFTSECCLVRRRDRAQL